MIFSHSGRRDPQRRDRLVLEADAPVHRAHLELERRDGVRGPSGHQASVRMATLRFVTARWTAAPANGAVTIDCPSTRRPNGVRHAVSVAVPTTSCCSGVRSAHARSSASTKTASGCAPDTA